MSRELDIVVFGATGFTGGLTAQYLAKHAPPELRWGIAGRSRSKLDAVKARLTAIDPRCDAVAVIEASVDDPASLERMAARTQVLLTTVGPFIDYGEPVVRACIAQGADYIDSTGEPFFVQQVLGKHGEAAQRSNVRVVNSCGFDSIPADLGALFTVLQLPSDRPIKLGGFISLKGVFSGGTERSAIKSLVPPKDLVQVPPPRARAGRSVALELNKLRKVPELSLWAATVPTIDPAIVLRSAATLDRYGPDFRYGHHVTNRSLLALLLGGVFFAWLALTVRIAPLRALLLKVVKPSGAGPSEAQMADAWFKLRFIAECDGKTLQTEVSGGDPGYGETSRMLAESALCLALDRAQLPARAGVLTTAEAMGEVLLARLQRAGLSFRVLAS
jgi:saccharopine dehydrogenase (NAD+, L-glutamate forming)